MVAVLQQQAAVLPLREQRRRLPPVVDALLHRVDVVLPLVWLDVAQGIGFGTREPFEVDDRQLHRTEPPVRLPAAARRRAPRCRCRGWRGSRRPSARSPRRPCRRPRKHRRDRSASCRSRLVSCPRARSGKPGQTAVVGRSRGHEHGGSVMGKLDGRVAIITGGARGQGAAEAALFAEEGASVFVTDVLVDEGEKTAAEHRRHVRRARRRRSAAVGRAGRAGRRRPRPPRHPGEQRRHPALGAHGRHVVRVVERGRGGEPDRRVPGHAGGRAADEGAARRDRSSTSRRSAGSAARARASRTRPPSGRCAA